MELSSNPPIANGSDITSPQPSIKKKQGFALLSPERLREIASRGGIGAHKIGTAHEWNKEEASAAGRKGGLKTAAKYAAKKEDK